MLYDFIIINKNDKAPLYRQIYMSVRKSIETGSLKKGTKLPSIRRLSADLDVSKTTVNGAYEQLCAEGYSSAIHPQKQIKRHLPQTSQKSIMNMISAVKALMTV